MTLIYIKFRHPDDIYALDPLYDRKLSEESVSPRVCHRCGDTLYIPVELSEEAEINQPMGEIYRPFPKEKPDLIIRGESKPIILSVPLPKLELESDELRRMESLKLFSSMAYVGFDSFEMLIGGASREPVKHECTPEFPSLDKMISSGRMDANTGEPCSPLD